MDSSRNLVNIGTGTFGGILKLSYVNPAFDLQESGTSRFRLELGASHTYLSTLGAYKMYLRTNGGAVLTYIQIKMHNSNNKVVLEWIQLEL